MSFLCPVKGRSSGTSDASQCPIASTKETADDSSNSTSAKATPDPAVEKLRSERETSTIPSATGAPWQYPSEKQFYRAAVAKGHDVPTQDMPAVIGVHNVVEEKFTKFSVEPRDARENRGI